MKKLYVFLYRIVYFLVAIMYSVKDLFVPFTGKKNCCPFAVASKVSYVMKHLGNKVTITHPLFGTAKHGVVEVPASKKEYGTVIKEVLHNVENQKFNRAVVTIHDNKVEYVLFY